MARHVTTVEEVLIEEECSDEEGLEWVLADDGFWYCTVTEEYEEEVLESPRYAPSANSKHPLPFKLKDETGYRSSMTLPKPTIPPALNISPAIARSRASSISLTAPSPRATKSTPNLSEQLSILPDTPDNAPSPQPERACVQASLSLSEDSVLMPAIPVKSSPLTRQSPKSDSRVRSKSKKSGAKKVIKTLIRAESPGDFSGEKKKDHSSKNLSPAAKLKIKQASAANKVAATKRIAEMKRRAATERVFGEELETLLHREKTAGKTNPANVPNIVYLLVEYIRANGCSANGIFRQSGHHSTQMEKETLFDQGIDITPDDLVITKIFLSLIFWLRYLFSF